MITELIEFGFKIELVLADSLYGEGRSFVRTLDKYNSPWIVDIRSNHEAWMPPPQRFRTHEKISFLFLHEKKGKMREKILI